MPYQEIYKRFKTRYSKACEYDLQAILRDCYDTLKVGGYAADHPYGQRLWAEIDAVRDIQLKRKA
jgi:hypothetical protein